MVITDIFNKIVNKGYAKESPNLVWTRPQICSYVRPCIVVA